MKIKRLYLGDMGIYRNSLMEDISSKIVVIGGFNRSGKTTLLETLRYLPYGFPKGLRQTVSEFDVEGDFINDYGDRITIKVKGLGEPQASSLNGSTVLTAKDVYGKVDSFTYKQLFTITLDELKRSGVKSEEERIQSVLLGAGLKSIVEIPKIIDEFKKEKEKIGGKYGNPTTKLLKVPYDKILEGIKLRDDALKQIQEYNSKCSELNNIEDEIKCCEKDINSLENKIIVFEILKAGYTQYNNKKNLELRLMEYVEPVSMDFSALPSHDRIESLREEYVTLYNNYKELLNEFRRNISSNECRQDKLIEFREDIKSFSKQMSGLKQKLSSYFTNKSQYDTEKGEILKRMNLLNQSWKGDLVKVLNINCDSLEQDKLVRLVDEVNEAEDRNKKYQYEFDNLISQRDIIKKEIQSLKTKDTSILIKKYLYISLCIVFLGAILFFVSKALGSSLSIIGVVTASLYFLIRYLSQNQLLARKRDLELQLESIEHRIDENIPRFEGEETSLTELYYKLKLYKDKLEVGEEMSNSGLLQYFKDVQDLKSRIINLGHSGKILETIEEELRTDLGSINTLVQNFYEDVLNTRENIIRNSKELFIRAELLDVQLQAAEELNSAKIKLADASNKIKKLLQIDCSFEDMIYELDSLLEKYRAYSYYMDLRLKVEQLKLQIKLSLAADRTLNALAEIVKLHDIKNEGPVECFEAMCDYYGSLEQIEREYNFAKREFDELIKRLDKLKDYRQELRTKINMLQTTEKIEKAQRMIDEGRDNIRPLALKFAEFSAAEYILDSVQKKFIENAKNTVLGGASAVLNKITSGEYKNILPQDNILQGDFKTVISDGLVQDSVSCLSRGTGEQLFLSVRLSRIKEIDSKLPVILDDPFVNFDSNHTKNVLEVVSGLGEENQIFILTCHPELVELIQSINNHVQFWKLDKGRFELSTCSDLVKYLSKR